MKTVTESIAVGYRCTHRGNEIQYGWPDNVLSKVTHIYTKYAAQDYTVPGDIQTLVVMVLHIN